MKNKSYLGEKKTRYKMYKKKKSWVTMGVTLFSVGIGLELGSTVNADNVSVKNLSSSQSIEISSSKVSSQSNTVQLQANSMKSSSSSVASKNATLQANSVKSSSSSVTSESTTSQLNSVKSSSSLLKSDMTKQDSQVINLTAKSQSSSQQTYPERYDTNGNGVFDGTKGKPMPYKDAYDTFVKNHQYQIMIYLLDANGDPNSEHDYQIMEKPSITFWNPTTGDAYYGAFSNTIGSPNMGVEFNAGKDGVFTVHAPIGWKFDIPYTKWYDPKRNGPYFVSANENEITFSFKKAIQAAITLKGDARIDCLNLFLVKDGEKAPEIPAVPENSYQNIINMVAADGGQEDDGAPVAQYVMNFHYGNQNPKEIHAKNPTATTFIVYAPKGYKFAREYSGEYNYIDPSKGIYAVLDLTNSPDPDHIAFFTTYDCPYGGADGGHYTGYNDPNRDHSYSDKVWVKPDKSWQGGPSNGFIIQADAVPTIDGKDQTVKVGAKLDLQSLVTAKDFDGKSITPSYSGNVDFNKPGKYTVTYTAKGEFNTVTKQITITVEAEDKPAMEPSKPSEDKPTDKPATEPSKPSENKPSEDKPADKPATEPSKPSEDKPADKPATGPSKPSEDKPTDKNVIESSKVVESDSVVESEMVSNKASESKTVEEPVRTNNGGSTAVKASKVSSKESAEKSNSGLPSTGETESKRTTAILGSAILGLLGLMGIKARKKY